MNLQTGFHKSGPSNVIFIADIITRLELNIKRMFQRAGLFVDFRLTYPT
jgi:hypothetical protein